MSQNVVNLAKNFTLTGAQCALLNRGLSFVPMIGLHKNQKTTLQLDVQTYHRRIKLAAYFKGSQNRTIPPFVGTSSWEPPLDKLPPEIGLLVDKDKNMLNSGFKVVKRAPNLSVREVKALRELMGNKTIVIKPADKGSAVVILSREQYVTEVKRQLSDSIYYKKLKEPIYLQTIPMVSRILDELYNKRVINKKQSSYLKGEGQPRPRRFYILPKIHKEPEKWTVPHEIPPGRPIVSDCGSETYQTAEFIDFYLNPLSVRHPSYVKDSYYFIDLVKSLTIPADSFLFSIDIDSLYTNIDIAAGLQAVREIFLKYPDANRPDKEILELLEINLRRNDFEFDGDFYLQIKGTAMGKRFAPAYANIFMAKWEAEALEKCPRKPLHYLRYLDDIWGVWTYSKPDFEEFIRTLNAHDWSIQCKYELDDKKIDFLDTTVYKGQNFEVHNKLDIKVFFKKTDTHALLYKTSFHPRHTYRGIVKAQLLRFHRICTRQEDFKEAVKELFVALRKRGYSRQFLRQCLRSFLDRKEALVGDRIPLITTYSLFNVQMHKKLKDNFDSLMINTGVLPNRTVISAYRRNKNLKDYLVRARLTSQQFLKPTVLFGTFCSLTFVKNRVKKTIFPVRRRFTPQSTNCVYLIFCVKCGMQYVGETKNSISLRMTQHRYNIKNRKERQTPLVEHFISHNYKSLRVAGLERNALWTDWERKKVERRWIYWLDTKEPDGLNIRFR